MSLGNLGHLVFATLCHPKFLKSFILPICSFEKYLLNLWKSLQTNKNNYGT